LASDDVVGIGAEDGADHAFIGVLQPAFEQRVVRSRRVDGSAVDVRQFVAEAVLLSVLGEGTFLTLLRFLHAQAYGRTKLPIYAGVADRDDLLAVICQRAELIEGTGNQEPGTGNQEQGTESGETGMESAAL
jgi:hypothetical protein